jgi:hypothetical protein
VPGKSSVEVFLRKLDVVYIDRWSRVFAGGEYDLGWLGSIGFHFPHFEPLLNCE